jgi:hypothetical protein
MTIDARFWTADLVLCLLPLVLLPTTAIAIALQYFWFRDVDLYIDFPRAVAIAVPIPLGASYFAFWAASAFSDKVDLKSYLFVAAILSPQAFILCAIGVWLLFAMVRGREFSILSTLTIVLIGIVGHLYTMMWIGVR